MGLLDIVTTTAGWLFLLRYIHFLAGITWIGVLYYFNFIQTPFFGSELGGGAKSAMTRGLVPNALWWFRWGAMFTFLSGWTIVIVNLMNNMGMASSWTTQILTGGVMGTFMWFNVWFIIWPAQQVVIENANRVAEGGEPNPAAAARGARAGTASRINTLFSIPMLFMMGSASHFSFISGATLPYWIAALVVMLAVEIHAFISGDVPTKAPLKSVSGTIHAGLALTLVLYVLGSLLT